MIDFQNNVTGEEVRTCAGYNTLPCTYIYTVNGILEHRIQCNLLALSSAVSNPGPAANSKWTILAHPHTALSVNLTTDEEY